MYQSFLSSLAQSFTPIPPACAAASETVLSVGRPLQGKGSLFREQRERRFDEAQFLFNSKALLASNEESVAAMGRVRCRQVLKGQKAAEFSLPL